MFARKLDFTTFGFSEAAADAKSPFTILGFAQYAAFLLAFIGLFLVLRRGSTAETDTAEVHATA